MVQSVIEIQEKALSVFSKYGLKSVNMDDLAFHTGVSKKMLYQLFNSKEELVFRLFEMIKNDWNKAVKEIQTMEENPVTKILTFYQLRYEYISKFNPAFLLRSGKQYHTIYLFISEVREQIWDVEKKLLDEAKQLGYVRKEFETATLVKAHEVLFDYFAEQFNPTTPKSKELFRHLMVPAIAGIIDPEKYDIGKDLKMFM